MNIYVDVDNTITETSGMDYQNAKPIYAKISIINKLYDLGHTITYWTARGSIGILKDDSMSRIPLTSLNKPDGSIEAE